MGPHGESLDPIRDSTGKLVGFVDDSTGHVFLIAGGGSGGWASGGCASPGGGAGGGGSASGNVVLVAGDGGGGSGCGGSTSFGQSVGGGGEYAPEPAFAPGGLIPEGIVEYPPPMTTAQRAMRPGAAAEERTCCKSAVGWPHRRDCPARLREEIGYGGGEASAEEAAAAQEE